MNRPYQYTIICQKTGQIWETNFTPTLRDLQTYEPTDSPDVFTLKQTNENIIVYHGTNKDFGEFDSNLQNSVTGFGDFGKGFYFTQSKGIAKYYTLKSKDNRTIIKTTVSINNPFIIDIDDEKFSTETKEKYMKLRYLHSYEVEIIKEYIMIDVAFAYKKINKEIGDSRFSDILQDNGYDGVIVNRTLGGETSIGAEIVVYNKNQIGKIEVEKV